MVSTVTRKRTVSLDEYLLPKSMRRPQSTTIYSPAPRRKRTAREIAELMRKVRVLRSHGFTWPQTARILGEKTHSWIFVKAKALGIK